MSIQNLWEMAKAERYTADGCDQIKKAQEQLAEDERYEIGQISKKTGLMKTANGWVEPKNGGTGNKKEGSKPAEKWQKTKDYLGRERISMKTPQGGLVSIYESDNPKQKNARFRVDTGSHYNEFNTMEEAKAFAEEHYGEQSKPSESEYNSAHAQLTKLKATSPKLQNDFEDHRDIVLKRVERGQPLKEAIETYEKEMKLSVPRMVEKNIMSEEEGKQYLNAWEDFKKQATSESKPAEQKPAQKDAAPRCLTGDCKVKLRKG